MMSTVKTRVAGKLKKLTEVIALAFPPYIKQYIYPRNSVCKASFVVNCVHYVKVS